LGGLFITINVEVLLNGQGLIFLLVLVFFDMMKLEAKGVELLDLMMDFCKDRVVIMDGFLGVQCVRMAVDPSYNPTIVAVILYDMRSGNGEQVESCVLAKEAEQHVESICLCQSRV